jgi:hypothetical protein
MKKLVNVLAWSLGVVALLSTYECLKGDVCWLLIQWDYEWYLDVFSETDTCAWLEYRPLDMFKLRVIMIGSIIAWVLARVAKHIQSTIKED